jgi:putative membrane protein
LSWLSWRWRFHISSVLEHDQSLPDGEYLRGPGTEKAHGSSQEDNQSVPGRRATIKILKSGSPARLCVLASTFALSWSTPANAGGSLTAHMASHIVLMNVVAPLIALAIIALFFRSRCAFQSKGLLPLATILQIVAIWTAHTPALLALSASDAFLHAGIQAGLFLISVCFWWSVFAEVPQRFWRALFALLITGKLFCLLGALLVFAPRSLYALHGTHSDSAVASTSGMEDQQLAGLLMLAACPLSYVIAGIVIASRSLKLLETRVSGSAITGLERS